MKALICKAFGPIESHKTGAVVVGDPAAGQIRITVKAASVNYPDALIVQGLYQVKPPVPFVPGAECSGVVEALGDGVGNLQIGDRVLAYVGQGAFAEQCLCDASRVVKLPDSMSFEEGAALMLTYATALHGLKDVAGLQAGEALVVLGAAGGVGTAAIEIGKAMGAKVIAAASSEEKLTLCRSIGADQTINYAQENLKDQINALTDKRGADVVFDSVGGDYTEASVRALNWRGRLLVVGFAAGKIPAIPLNLALLKERQILGVYWGDAAKRNPEAHAANVHQLLNWYTEGKIRPHVSEVFTLDQAGDALSHIAGRKAQGKVVIRP